MKNLLAHKFSIHEQTKKSLAFERKINHKLISLYNQFDLSNTNIESEVAISKDLKLRFILKKNRALKRAIKEYKTRIKRDKYMIDSSEITIKTLKEKKRDILYTLNKKEIKLSKTNN